MAKKDGALIYDKGLPAPDAFQLHALETVHIWGLDVAREFSQEYGERGASQVIHIRGHVYSPPTTGWVGIPPTMHKSFSREGMNYGRIPKQAWECHIDRVVKIGISNEHADFNDPVAYHGVRADRDAPLPTGRWRGSLRPLVLEATRGCRGRGAYLTPSFGMAASYAFRSWTSEERFSRHGPDGTCFLVVLMCAVPQGKYTPARGSAFSHNSDGWQQDAIEWVVKDPRDAKVYGALFCYFRPRWEPQPDPSLTARSAREGCVLCALM